MKTINLIQLCIVSFVGMPVYSQTLSEAQEFVGVYEILEECAIASTGASEFNGDDIFETDGRFLLSIEEELNDSNDLKLSIIKAFTSYSLPKNFRAKSSGNMQFQFNETLVLDSSWSEYIKGTGILKNEHTLELEYFLRSSLSCDAVVCRSKGQKVDVSTSAATPYPNSEINIYFDHHLNSLIFESVSTQSFQFELYDLSGRCVLRKTNADGSPIPAPNLPVGIYPYRLQENSRVLKTGKILK